MLSEIPDTYVHFHNGVSQMSSAQHLPDHATFLPYAPIPNVVSRSTEERWAWHAVSFNGHEVGDGLIATNGPSVAYSILGEPVEPWTDASLSNQNAWTSALDFIVTTNACEGSTTETDALASLTQFLFSGHGLVYDKENGESAYTQGMAGWFDLSAYIAKSATMSVFETHREGNVVNCYDQAGALTCLGRVVGIPSDYVILQPFGYLNRLSLVGIGPCNNPFFGDSQEQKEVDANAPRSSFRNHAFVRHFGMVFDACGGPEIGTNSVAAYLESVIDRSTQWEAASAAPTNATPSVYDFRFFR